MKFRPRSRLNVCLALGAAALAAIAAAQQFTYRDKGGNMTLSGLTSWKIVRLSESEFSFEGAGNPYVGEWKRQQLTVRGASIAGKARREGESGFNLTDARMAGGVNVQVKRPSGNTWLEAGRVDLTNSASGATAKLSGDVHVRRGSEAKGDGTDFWSTQATVSMASLNGGAPDPVRTISTDAGFRIVQTTAGSNPMSVTATGRVLNFDVPSNRIESTAGLDVVGRRQTSEGPQNFQLSAARGEVVLYPADTPSPFPVRQCDLTGGVKMSLNTERRGKDGKKNPVRLSGRCQTIRYVDSDRTMVLSGGVFLEGSDSAIFGTVENATQAIIRLDEQRNFLSVELRGEPGTSTVREQRNP